MSRRAVQIVQAVTRPEGPAYLDWVAEFALSGSLSAVRVKIADNEDNRDPSALLIDQTPQRQGLPATQTSPARKRPRNSDSTQSS